MPLENGDLCKTYFGDERDLGGKGKEYVQFIVEELKPLIDQKYRTKADDTMMAGISLGGLISIYAACRYPEIFKRVAGLSSGFWRNQEEIEAMLKRADLSRIEGIYLDCGTTETDDERINIGFMNSNRDVYEIIKDKAPSTTFKIIEHGRHKYHAFQKRVPDFLHYLLQDLTARTKN